MPSYYRTIKGKKYDREILEQAEQAVAGKGDGRISMQDAQALLQTVTDNANYTTIEKNTIQYIRDNFKFTKEADDLFRKEIRSWAAKKGHKNIQDEKKTAAPTKASTKKSSAKKSTAKKTTSAKKVSPPKQKETDNATKSSASTSKAQAKTETEPKSDTAKDFVNQQSTQEPTTPETSPKKSLKDSNESMNDTSERKQETSRNWLKTALIFLLMVAIILLIVFFTDQCGNTQKTDLTDKKILTENNDKKIKNQDSNNQTDQSDKINKSAANNVNQQSNAKKIDNDSKASDPAPNQVKQNQNIVPDTQNTPNGVYTIQSGDTLTKISKKYLGNENDWEKIYQKNKEKIKDPNLIYPGQKIQVK